VIPIRDENPTAHPPVLTIALIIINVFVYFFVQPHAKQGLVTSQADEARFTYEYAAIPEEVKQGHPLTCEDLNSDAGPPDCSPGAPPDAQPFPHKNVYLALLYSMFLHGSLLHIGGNMLFLWVFGNNIEDRMGKVGYLVFYLIGGLVSALAHIFVDTSSTIPIIGASGAIAAVMGAYLVLFPNAPVRTLFIYFIILFRDIPAKWLLIFWFVSQFFISPGSGVAWVAHVGGFVFGVIVAGLLRSRLRPPPELAWRY
jgi:membrane associated rhomboid family serine protease